MARAGLRRTLLPWLTRRASVPYVTGAERNVLETRTVANAARDVIDTAALINRMFATHTHMDLSKHVWPTAAIPPGVDSDIKNRLSTLLIERLDGVVDLDTSAVFYGCNGNDGTSTAVRDALRRTGRPGVVRVQHSYHGAGVAAVPLGTDPRCTPVDIQLHTIPRPRADGADADACLEASRRTLAGANVGALIFEGSSGTQHGSTWPGDYVERLVAVAREHGALCIADEVLSGLGRTGPAAWCAAAHGCSAELRLDYVVFGKALTNGALPLSAVVMSDATPYDDQPFMEGRTFSGYTLGLHAAYHQLTKLDREQSQVQAASAQLADAVAPLAADGIEVRGRGMLRTIVVPGGAEAAQLARLRLLAEHGVRAFGLEDRILLAPAIGDLHIDESIAAIHQTIAALPTP